MTTTYFLAFVMVFGVTALGLYFIHRGNADKAD